jgi:hypothetical protein
MERSEQDKMWLCIKQLAVAMSRMDNNFRELCGVLQDAGILSVRPREDGSYEPPNFDGEGGDYGGNPNTLN